MVPVFWRHVFVSILAGAWFLGGGVHWSAADNRKSLELDFAPDPLARFHHPPVARLDCPAVAAAPGIDGVLNEAVWEQAALLGALGEDAPATIVRVCVDERAIYVGAICENRKGQGGKEQPAKRDEVSIKDDRIDIWIVPDRRRVTFYHFAVSAAGSISDALCYSGRTLRGHNPTWYHATSRNESGWSVELAIPLAALELAWWPDELGFNLGRRGPGIRPRAWNGKYGDPQGSVLALPPALANRPEAAGASSLLTAGRGLELEFERLQARPGERWIEGTVRLASQSGSLSSCRLTVALMPVGETAPVAEITVVPTRRAARLRADLRRHGLRQARLRVVLEEEKRPAGSVEAFLSASDPQSSLPAKTRVPVYLDLPEGIDQVSFWPVTFGVPFAPGVLWETSDLRVLNGEGRELPFQCEPAGYWAWEGSLQWVRFDALVNCQPKQRKELNRHRDAIFVAIDQSPAGQHRPPLAPANRRAVSGVPPVASTQKGKALTVRQQGTDIVVDTGVARYTLGLGPSPIKEIRRGDRVVATSRGARGLYLIDQRGRVASASAEGEDVRIEARGPVAACVRLEGFYRTEDGQQLGRHTTRVEMFAGQPFAQVSHTFTITCDTNEIWFKDIGWELAVMPGAEPRASFGLSRDDWPEYTTQPVFDRQTVSMLQDSHYRHAHGKNHFSLDSIDEQGNVRTLVEGTECGDWASLHGSAAGLMVSCRETARQHPKELLVCGDKLTLKLHSARAGEELDFRMQTLVKRWDLQNWHDQATSESRRIPIVERALEHTSNAIGWSRTSFLAFAPLAPGNSAKEAARVSRLTSAQVYAHADPEWVCASSALGPIHRKDRDRFPDAERAIEAAFRQWEKRIDDWGDYGFVDYFNGPHLSYRNQYVIQKRYSKSTYTLKPDLWRLYARSGERRLRSFIENVARTFMDVDVAQWDGDGRVKGLCHSPPGSDLDPSTPHNLPMPWAGPAVFHYSSATNMNLVAWDYYLTGNRRAKDILFDFAEGAKRHWTPELAARDGRSLMVFRSLVQTYAFTWDPELRALAEATADQFYDPQGELALTKQRPYSSSYKTQVDLRAIEDGWNILGGRRYHEMLTKMASRWWIPLLGHWPHFYCNPQGRVGSLLYRETGRPHIPQVLATQLRYSASAYDPVNDHTFGCENASACTFLFEGLPYAMSTLVASGGDREPTASWVGYEDFGYPSSIVIWKGGHEAVDLYVVTSNPGERAAGDILPACPKIELIDADTRYGLDLYRLCETSACGSRIRLPKDGPEGAYRITAPAKGLHICYADSRTPLVVYAPEYWRPAPAQQPAVRYFFLLPEGTRDGQIFFEGTAQLFDPQDRPWHEGKPQHGWVSLPADQPGLWSFLPIENELVRARNLPPFFAAESASSYFQPNIPLKRQPASEFQRPPADQVFVPGAIASTGNQAVQLTGKRSFRLEGGPPHPSGDGLRFLPFRQGTIELWMKPNWHTADLQPKGAKSLVYVSVQQGDPWTLWHYVQPRARDVELDFLYSHVLYGCFLSDGLAKATTLRRYRRTVFEPGEWTHVAWVWGQEDGIVPGNPPYHTKVHDGVLRARIFVNGTQGTNTGYRWYGNEPAHLPIELNIGRHYDSANLDAAVDELRISDVQRYLEDFKVSRKTELKLDEHTRALFHFNGNLRGESWQYTGELPASLSE